MVLLFPLIMMRGRTDWPEHSVVSLIGRVAVLSGLTIIGLAAVNLGTALTPTPMPKEAASLRTTGLFRFVRHPIYSGVLLAVLGTLIGSRSFVKLALGLFVLAFFTLKARWEERRLTETYPEYSAYCAVTPRFVPSWRRRENH
jgi:protein-S-isoprenylcysteine O-methyltransferase Ste14